MTRHLPALIFLLLVGLGFGAWFFLKPDPQGSALRVRSIATRGLAEHLARAHPGKRALVVSNPFTRQPGIAKDIVEAEDAGLRGLREGFGNSITLAAVVFPPLKPDALKNPRSFLGETETTTPLSYLVTPDAFDQLARQHSDCEFIVSLIGLPVDFERSESWMAEGKPRFALLLPDFRVAGNAAVIEAALTSGKLAAFVVRRPGAPGDDIAPTAGFREEFERRFILVTSENFESVRRSHPSRF